jgi:hypothetical protein
MTDQEPKRHRGLVDDARGGLTTFLLEIGIVVGLALGALILSAVILLLV